MRKCLGFQAKESFDARDRRSTIQSSQLKCRKSLLPPAGLFDPSLISFGWLVSDRRRKQRMNDSGFFPNIFQLTEVSCSSQWFASRLHLNWNSSSLILALAPTPLEWNDSE
jgi:hypothetical protein